MSINAYTRTLRNTEDPRQIERRVLSQVTSSLARHADTFDAAAKTDRVMLLDATLKTALEDNQKVWSTLRMALALPGNGLPEQLRADLISLSIWVDEQTRSVLGTRGRIAPLVEINRNIIAGLAQAAPVAMPAEA